jgi:hypothetical protein
MDKALPAIAQISPFIGAYATTPNLDSPDAVTGRVLKETPYQTHSISRAENRFFGGSNQNLQIPNQREIHHVSPRQLSFIQAQTATPGDTPENHRLSFNEAARLRQSNYVSMISLNDQSILDTDRIESQIEDVGSMERISMDSTAYQAALQESMRKRFDTIVGTSPQVQVKAQPATASTFKGGNDNWWRKATDSIYEDV